MSRMPKVNKTTALIAGAASALAAIGGTVALTPAASAASTNVVLSDSGGGCADLAWSLCSASFQGLALLCCYG